MPEQLHAPAYTWTKALRVPFLLFFKALFLLIYFKIGPGFWAFGAHPGTGFVLRRTKVAQPSGRASGR